MIVQTEEEYESIKGGMNVGLDLGFKGWREMRSLL